jgi:hypothetical protein
VEEAGEEVCFDFDVNRVFVKAIIRKTCSFFALDDSCDRA